LTVEPWAPTFLIGLEAIAMIQPRWCILLVVLTFVSATGPRRVVAQQGGQPTVLWQFEAGG
jgi:hypothetical protein